MNASFTVTRNVQDEMLLGDIHFDSDTFKALLMRASFSFSTTNHSHLWNIKSDTGAITYNIAASAGTITRTAGSFLTDGFLAGNYFTTNDGTHTGVYRITTVTATIITATVISGAILNETGNPYTATITTDDEYLSTDGYTQGGQTATWTLTNGLAYLDTIPLSATYAAGGFGAAALALSPGFLVYDDTLATADVKQIICYARVADWRVNV